ncbi:hypothetical protein NDU88_008175 [Pleurodeles waltl]|uniref:Uncharacterized protein n=1 Tax=Pleurodeles waltl TaxID=8319 RepID=A0AAV7RTX0_PLEWA|nr:hypothetical protein NDU88_008175 [Pleurodeles waltl]
MLGGPRHLNKTHGRRDGTIGDLDLGPGDPCRTESTRRRPGELGDRRQAWDRETPGPIHPAEFRYRTLQDCGQVCEQLRPGPRRELNEKQRQWWDRAECEGPARTARSILTVADLPWSVPKGATEKKQASTKWGPPATGSRLGDWAESSHSGTMRSRATEWDAHKVVIRGTCISVAGGVRQTLTQDLQKYEHDVRMAECKLAEGTITEAELGRL